MTVEVLAPAKVNLALHVTGRRDDGYHLLDTLVAFGPVADRLTFDRSDRLELTITGPEAKGLTAADDNLVMRAARLIAGNAGARIVLEKHLPVAAGIGGGSADAAATLRGLGALLDRSDEFTAMNWQADDVALRPMAKAILDLGADVPMCLLPRGLRARGIGERITPVELPPLPCILVNPRQAVPTGAVFEALRSRDNAPLPDSLPAFDTPAQLIGWLQDQRNDLQPAAIAAAPVIAEVLAELEKMPGCRLARMSGSGATCFALFDDADLARAQGNALRERRPDWWIAGGLLGDRQRWWLPKVPG